MSARWMDAMTLAGHGFGSTRLLRAIERAEPETAPRRAPSHAHRQRARERDGQAFAAQQTAISAVRHRFQELKKQGRNLRCQISAQCLTNHPPLRGCMGIRAVANHPIEMTEKSRRARLMMPAPGSLNETKSTVCGWDWPPAPNALGRFAPWSTREFSSRWTRAASSAS